MYRHQSRTPRYLAICLLAVSLSFLFTASANASQLIDRNATNVTLGVNAQGIALLTYKLGKVTHHVLAKGAINALPPTAGKRQVEFKLDYSGGWKFFPNVGSDWWKKFKNVCGPYTGPALAWAMPGLACTMPDGSHWALQSWQRALPNYGLAPNAMQKSWELRLSHWNTDLAVLDIHTDWAHRGDFDHLWGKLTYLGNPVYGFHSTSTGMPLDNWSRNIYLDTYDSGYGKGWKRENGFLTHQRSGAFCYGFYRHGNRPIGNGTQYRATVDGPGVTPDVMWQGPEPGPYDAALDAIANAQEKIDLAGDKNCLIN